MAGTINTSQDTRYEYSTTFKDKTAGTINVTSKDFSLGEGGKTDDESNKDAWKTKKDDYLAPKEDLILDDMDAPTVPSWVHADAMIMDDMHFDAMIPGAIPEMPVIEDVQEDVHLGKGDQKVSFDLGEYSTHLKEKPYIQHIDTTHFDAGDYQGHRGMSCEDLIAQYRADEEKAKASEWMNSLELKKLVDAIWEHVEQNSVMLDVGPVNLETNHIIAGGPEDLGGQEGEPFVNTQQNWWEMPLDLGPGNARRLTSPPIDIEEEPAYDHHDGVIDMTIGGENNRFLWFVAYHDHLGMQSCRTTPDEFGNQQCVRPSIPQAEEQTYRDGFASK